MAIFEVTDKESGLKVRIRGDSAPTEAELEQIFASLPQSPQTTQETAQERALRLGAKPGIALTPEQQQQITQGQQITPNQSTLPADRAFQPVGQTKFQDPLARSTVQGIQNIGSGILRGLGELRQLAGDKEAQQFLADLSQGTAIDQGRTEQITEGSPISSFAGQVAGETIGFPFGGVGKSLITKLLSGAAASGVGSGLSAAGRGESGEDIAKEGLIGASIGAGLIGTGEGAARGIKKLRENRAEAAVARQLGIEAKQADLDSAIADVSKGQEISELSGIRLLPAQKTLDPFQREQTAFLGQNPEVSRRALRTLKTQNKESAVAVSELLNDIAPAERVGTASAQVQKKAGNIIDAAKLIRTERTSPIYENAFDIAQRSGKRVNTAPVLNLIDQRLEDFTDSGLVSKELQKVRAIIDTPKTARLRVAHNAKMEIDDLIRRGINKDTLSDVAVRELAGVQNALLRQMDSLNVGYEQARQQFRELSPAVDDLRNGVFGQITRLSPQQLKRASTVLFDATETNPAIMKNAVKTLKSVEGGADIARALLRTEIEKRLGKVRPGLIEGGKETVENVPARLNKAVFGNEQQSKVLFAALNELSPDAASNAKWLQRGLKRASIARPGGSQTGIRAEISRRLQGASLAIRQFFRQPLETTIGVGEEAAQNARARALGDALYNPNWQPDMEKIRALNPNSQGAAAQFEKLLNIILRFNERTGAGATAGRVSSQERREK